VRENFCCAGIGNHPVAIYQSIQKPRNMSDEDKPKSKKLKREEEDDDDDEEEEENSDGPAVEKNEKGEAFFKISAKRRVTISKFKGTTMIDIREVS
jgi:hypothetical protein